MAPELFCSQKYTERADVYSFGMGKFTLHGALHIFLVVWEILTRQIPFSDKDSWAIPGLADISLNVTLQSQYQKARDPLYQKSCILWWRSLLSTFYLFLLLC